MQACTHAGQAPKPGAAQLQFLQLPWFLSLKPLLLLWLTLLIQHLLGLRRSAPSLRLPWFHGLLQLLQLPRLLWLLLMLQLPWLLWLTLLILPLRRLRRSAPPSPRLPWFHGPLQLLQLPRLLWLLQLLQLPWLPGQGPGAPAPPPPLACTHAGMQANCQANSKQNVQDGPQAAA
jgi:hypothetical protein